MDQNGLVNQTLPWPRLDHNFQAQMQTGTNNGVQVCFQDGDINFIQELKSQDEDASSHRHRELRKARIGQGVISRSRTSSSEPELGLCDWFLERNFYKDWDEDEARTSVLWIQGPAGCGKSTIASRIVDELGWRSTRGDIHLLYFYINATNEELNGQDALLRSFMNQANKFLDPAINLFSPPYQNGTEKIEAREIQDRLFRYLRHEARLPVYIIVDGLDELEDNDCYWLIETLIEEHESSSSNLNSCFKVLLTSRDDGIRTIQEFPSAADRRTKVHPFEIQPKDTIGDIQSFIRRELVPLCNGKFRHSLDSNRQTNIVKSLTEHANGMFLWVYFQMKIICSMPTIHLIDNHIKELAIPGKGSGNGIHVFYEHMMEKLRDPVVVQSQRDIARKVFTLLLHTPGPIAVEALLEAIFVSPAESQEYRHDSKKIVRICKHLVDMDEDLHVFQWTHYSVYEYFATPRPRNGDPSTEPWKRPHEHLALEQCSDDALVAEICLSYLCRDAFSEGKLVPQTKGKQINSPRYGDNPLKTHLNNHKFLAFASTRWASHSRLSMADEKSKARVSIFLLDFYERESNMQLAFQVFLLSRNAHIIDGICRIHIFSYFHLSGIFKELADQGLLETKSRAVNGYTAVHWAVDSYNSLADRTVSKESSHPAVDHYQNGVLDTVKELIARGADANIQDGEGRTPLYHAAKQGYLKVVEELLRTKGVKVDRHSRKLGTPLIVASYKGHAPIVKRLIEAGANVKIKTLPLIGTALHEAAFYGEHEIVEMLLKKGFKVNSMSTNYGSPLQAAAAGCYKRPDRTPADLARPNVTNQRKEITLTEFKTIFNILLNMAQTLMLEVIAEREGYENIVELFRQHGKHKPPILSDQIPEGENGRNDSRKQDEVLGQGRFVSKVIAVPSWMFMNALKADDERRMEIFFTAYECIIEQAIRLNKIESLRTLASVGEQVFKDIVSFTVLRHSSQAGKSHPIGQTADTKENPSETADTISNNSWNLAKIIFDILVRISNRWRRKRRKERNVTTVAGSETEEFPFYSEDPAFKTLDRLTNIAVTILGDAIKKEKVAAVDLLSDVWTRALHHVQSQDDIGDEMLRDLMNSRIDEVISHLNKGNEEAGKSIARVAVQLLATAIGRGEMYKHLAIGLARIWAFAMEDIRKLGERKGHDYLSPLLDTVLEAVRTAIKKGDGGKIEELAQVIFAVFGHVVKERLDNLFDKAADICFKVWNMITAPECPQSKFMHGALKGRADRLIELLQLAVKNNRTDILEFAREQGEEVSDEIIAELSRYVPGLRQGHRFDNQDAPGPKCADMRYRLRWIFLAGVLSVFAIIWKLAPSEFDELDAAFFPPYPGSKDYYVSVPRTVVSFGDAWSAIPPLDPSCRRDSRGASSLLHQLSRTGLSWFCHGDPAAVSQSNIVPPSLADAESSAGRSEPVSELSPSLMAQLWTEFQKTVVTEHGSSPSRHEAEDGGDVSAPSDAQCLSPPQTWNERLCYDYIYCINLKSYAPVGRLVGINHSDPAYSSIQSSNDGDPDSSGSVKDLVFQVEEWLGFIENERWAAWEAARASNETSSGWEYDFSTLFTVWVGMAEVLKYSLLPRGEAIKAVDRSLDTLFVALYHLAASVSSPAILLPHVVDVTTLPAFRDHILLSSRISPYLSTQILKNANFLRRYWNQGLEIRAGQFRAGQIISWDVEDWFAAELRRAAVWRNEDDMHKGVGFGGYGRRYIPKSASGIDVAGFADVSRPCVTGDGGELSVCSDEDKHLMWDNIHLSGRAHEELARGAADLVIQLWLSDESYLHPPTRADRWTLFKGMGMKEGTPNSKVD
ncbi:Ankyrin-3 [Drechslerella dactyloides]|uniref:Ankyrin-3 n=1 Tax=Drechslerella dactyloides TaxID=74499 RepID=A0AAD6IXT3_DREDA|nr:Ankyrin-3 [Drechslerella dactyloides]